ncbi:MAG: chlorophyll synthase ChlG [Paracoccaceae bacterium]|nr:chlorophyll synthase ChlG [Paracoccaceae bacterium]
MTVLQDLHSRQVPNLFAALELIKPITWFPPMWAYTCGAVSAGVGFGSQLWIVFLGVFLAGPVVCGMSQAANDWCDRHVDAINQPERPIPSGRIPGKWGLWIALIMTSISLIMGTCLGVWGFTATVVAVMAAWAYSAEPLRFKKSGWWGPGLVGLCYEGLPWFTGAAVISASMPSTKVIIVATLYAIGAHGIMTLNDFKALEGDRQTGIRSLPVVLGPRLAGLVACITMAIPQFIVVLLLYIWIGPSLYGIVISALILGQVWAMQVMMSDPKEKAPWYNATGVTMYVSGMMVCAFALRALEAGL